MDYFQILPLEITLDILTRVPTECVLDCKLVCTSWNNLFHHPSFSKMHFHHLNHSDDSGKLGFLAFPFWKDLFWYFEYNENHESAPIERISRVNITPPFCRINFVGSCNGLICLVRNPFLEQADKPVCICNPITKEYVILPEIKTDCCDNDKSDFWISGFGYVSSTNEYKVVRIMLTNKFYEVHIYTLGSRNGWRNLGKLYFENRTHPRGRGIFANGDLYWIDRNFEMIVTFNLAEEKFREYLSPPPLPPESYRFKHRIGVLDGFLSVNSSLLVEGENFYDIWLLKKKNDNHDMKEQENHQSLGWSKEVRVGDGKPLAITKRNGILTYNKSYLNIYDTKGSTSKRLVKFKDWLFQVSPHKNTLVSLKELGEEDTKVMESVEIKETRSREQLQEDPNPDYIYL